LSDDEFEDAEDLEIEEDDLDVDDLVEDDDLVAGDDDDDDDVDVLDEDLDVVPEIPVAVITDDPVVTEVAEEEDDDVVDLDEELHPDDVEEALDVVLRERTAAAGLEDDEEEDEEPDERGETGTKIVPRRDNEFLCKSCFLVLPRHQLADEKRMICRDCA